MKVLILSCNTGGGHNACAKAIKEIFDLHGDICHIEDSIRFVSVKLSHFMTWGHNTMYRHIPSLFRLGYDFAEKHPEVLKDDGSVYKLLTSGTKSLQSFLNDGNYDTVICTHVFSGLLLSQTLQKYPMDIVTAFVSTDYTCSPGVAKSNLDLYFIPGVSLINEFIACGVPEHRILVSGVPVSQAFYKHTDKKTAKKHYGVDPEHNHLLVMCGSMGCGPLKKITDLLSVRLSTECEVSIVCGTNERLQSKLTEQYRNRNNIHIYGFVQDIASLMECADLYLTKPGGLSTSEGSVKELPMVFMNTVAGCEEHNLQYFVNIEGAVTAASVWELTEQCAQLLEDPEKREQMSLALAKESHINSAQYIYTTLHNLQSGRGDIA